MPVVAQPAWEGDQQDSLAQRVDLRYDAHAMALQDLAIRSQLTPPRQRRGVTPIVTPCGSCLT